MSDNITIHTRDDIEQTKEYVVKGTDGWNLVTNDPVIAKQESQKSQRNYGEHSVFY